MRGGNITFNYRSRTFGGNLSAKFLLRNPADWSIVRAILRESMSYPHEKENLKANKILFFMRCNRADIFGSTF
jgi:hypothetical protein